MRYLLALSLSFFMAFTVHADVKRKQSYGALDVHYNIFNSTMLQPETAQAVGLNRSKNLAILNVSMVKAGKGQKGAVVGSFQNLLGQSQTLAFKEIDEAMPCIIWRNLLLRVKKSCALIYRSLTLKGKHTV